MAALLSAPKPGSELRSELIEKTDDIKVKADDLTDYLRSNISPGVAEISNRIAPTISSAKEKISPLVDEINKQFSKSTKDENSDTDESK